MIKLTVSQNDSGQRINKYLMKYLDKAPSSFIYKMLRKKNIVLNGSKAKGDELLTCGDEIKLFLSDETISNFRALNESEVPINNNISLQILYNKHGILAVHKTAGILSQKAKRDDYSINEAIIDYCKQNNIISSEELDTFTPSVCNRLDRNTTGIILAGTTLSASRYLSSVLKDRTAHKFYGTVVLGRFEKECTINAYILRDEALNKSSVISSEEYDHIRDKELYQPISTKFIPVAYSDNLTLLKIMLITGKSHQIRAHLKYLGHPIVGDFKYGDDGINRKMRDQFHLKFHLLHAMQVILPNTEYTGEQITINDNSFPDVFVRICEKYNLSLEKLF